MYSQKRSSLRKRVEEDLAEEDESAHKLIETLVKSFLRADSDYGAITEIRTDINYIYKIIKNYISKENLDVYALKIGNVILLSKTNVGFDEIYEVIRERSHLEVKKGIIEIWDDLENGILHFLIIPLRKHFPIEYATDEEKEKTVKILIDEYSEA
ncbi:MAG: hypothetical protein QXX94_00765 [Candidatus Bathyarchaeia archaeon]